MFSALGSHDISKHLGMVRFDHVIRCEKDSAPKPTGLVSVHNPGATQRRKSEEILSL